MRPLRVLWKLFEPRVRDSSGKPGAHKPLQGLMSEDLQRIARPRLRRGHAPITWLEFGDFEIVRFSQLLLSWAP
jgi:hypothetical protein